jgi:hypothetical protein
MGVDGQEAGSCKLAQSFPSAAVMISAGANGWEVSSKNCWKIGGNNLVRLGLSKGVLLSAGQS